jgi:hypothetical protein
MANRETIIAAHGFVGHADAPSTWCVVPDSRTENGYCGQPKDAAIPHVGQRVTWLQQRRWGGKQNVPAKYLHGVGVWSARIEIDGGEEKTVRLSSLRWEQS